MNASEFGQRLYVSNNLAVITAMGIGMSPAKMLVAKVVSHRDLERETILALEEF
jgi:hypothetical protein